MHPEAVAYQLDLAVPAHDVVRGLQCRQVAPFELGEGDGEDYWLQRFSIEEIRELGACIDSLADSDRERAAWEV